MPNKETKKPQTERECLIEQLRAQVETAERRGHYNTAHHEMLNQLLSKE